MKSMFFLGLAIVCLLWASGVRAEEEWTDLSLSGDSLQHWRFISGNWEQDSGGVIRPPHNLADENLAMFTKHAYGDFEAEFEFRWDIDRTTAALVFRAQDTEHYYVVDFSCVGQQYRAEHFWGLVSKVDERNMREGLHMEMMHGISSAVFLWHKARVVVKGDEIRVWCDGRPLAVVRDKTFSTPGFVGLTSFSCFGGSAKSSFRNLRIRGRAVEPPKWDESIRPKRNWGIVAGAPGRGCSNIVRASGGDLLVSSGRMFRSADNGRTWVADGTGLPEYVKTSVLHEARDGGLEAYHMNVTPAPFKIQRGRSDDQGRTWSEPQELGEIKFPQDFQIPNPQMVACRLLETKDGTLLWFAYARETVRLKVIKGRMDRFRTAPSGMNACLRSTDGGKTWSEPIDIDGPPYSRHWILRKNASEISVTQTAQGDLLALVRAWQSPRMWESWSRDDGKTWSPLARGAFPMYACNNSMLTTTSGVILIAGRFPGIAMQVSRDNGLTWKFYQLDRCIYANGAMYEVEPNVVLYVYGGWNRPQQLRYQLIRVTSDGVEPIRDGVVTQLNSEILPKGIQ